MKEYFTIVYFGSPGEGYEAYPHSFATEYSGLTGGHKKLGDVDSQYIINKSGCEFFYAIHGLTAERYGSVRGGKSFGVGVKIINHELSSGLIEDRLYNFLKEFVNQAVASQSLAILEKRNDRITGFITPNFQSISTKLDRLTEKFIENFISSFENEIIQMINGQQATYELDPIKIERKNQIERESKASKKSISKVEPPIGDPPNNSGKEETIGPKKKKYLLKVLKYLLTTLLVTTFGLCLFQLFKLNTLIDHTQKLSIRLSKAEDQLKVIYVHPTKDDKITIFKGRTRGKAQYDLKIRELDATAINEKSYSSVEKFYLDLVTLIINAKSDNITYMYENDSKKLLEFISSNNNRTKDNLNQLFLKSKSMKGKELIEAIGVDFLIGQHQ